MSTIIAETNVNETATGEQIPEFSLFTRLQDFPDPAEVKRAIPIIRKAIHLSVAAYAHFDSVQASVRTAGICERSVIGKALQDMIDSGEIFIELDDQSGLTVYASETNSSTEEIQFSGLEAVDEFERKIALRESDESSEEQQMMEILESVAAEWNIQARDLVPALLQHNWSVTEASRVLGELADRDLVKFRRSNQGEVFLIFTNEAGIQVDPVPDRIGHPEFCELLGELAGEKPEADVSPLPTVERSDDFSPDPDSEGRLFNPDNRPLREQAEAFEFRNAMMKKAVYQEHHKNVDCSIPAAVVLAILHLHGDINHIDLKSLKERCDAAGLTKDELNAACAELEENYALDFWYDPTDGRYFAKSMNEMCRQFQIDVSDAIEAFDGTPPAFVLSKSIAALGHELSEDERIILDAAQTLNMALMRGGAVRFHTLERTVVRFHGIERKVFRAAYNQLTKRGILLRDKSRIGVSLLRCAFKFKGLSDAEVTPENAGIGQLIGMTEIRKPVVDIMTTTETAAAEAVTELAAAA
jgi:hypothetical protein